MNARLGTRRYSPNMSEVVYIPQGSVQNRLDVQAQVVSDGLRRSRLRARSLLLHVNMELRHTLSTCLVNASVDSNHFSRILHDSDVFRCSCEMRAPAFSAKQTRHTVCCLGPWRANFIFNNSIDERSNRTLFGILAKASLRNRCN